VCLRERELMRLEGHRPWLLRCTPSPALRTRTPGLVLSTRILSKPRAEDVHPSEGSGTPWTFVSNFFLYRSLWDSAIKLVSLHPRAKVRVLGLHRVLPSAFPGRRVSSVAA
jgi:hypothetical protein